ncbi:MAG: aminodeoxychorismate/anthranilate synthase component II [Candidatus Muirbacterium halophilum]|nr:aminodeoxychorismate/anthranilate synthase component II [Candidatus Muirbacterium halophilum]
MDKARATNILIIDNYDSFTQTISYYLKNLEVNTTIIKNDFFNDNVEFLNSFDGCIISPGPGNLLNIGLCEFYINKFIDIKKPVLGICLGHQIIASLYGGILKKADHPYHGETRKIYFNDDVLFDGLKSPCVMTCYNSLIIDECYNHDIQITAWTKNPFHIMAVKHKKHKLYGVQFHPESFLSEGGEWILKNFLKMI